MKFAHSPYRAFGGFSNSVRRAIERWKLERSMHPSVQRYIDFCRNRWPVDYPINKDSVVLVGLFTWNPVVHCFAHLSNYIARKTGSSIEWFHFFRHQNFLYEKIYAAFGARQGIGMRHVECFRPEAERIADEWFAGLKTKWDVVNLSLDGIQLGDLIYDSYLRAGFHGTVQLDDPALRELMLHAVQIYLGVKDYFARHKVVAVIADHTYYIFCGLLVRLAACAGVPCYQFHCGQDGYILEVKNDRPNSDVVLRHPWPRYAQLFAQMPPAEQTAAREQGRRSLEERLRGRVDATLLNITAYGDSTAQPVLKLTGRKRVLVLINDFFDAVHMYRRMLFPDFYEWVDFVLQKAANTDFDWYVKPHPNMLIYEKLGQGGQKAGNQKIISALQEKYPKAHFLHPSVSNRQIMAEGIDALFTVHGTAGHEFGFIGVPVVNGGDNQHIAYSFNLHPRNLEEFEHYIANAGNLKLAISKDEIAEYVYMNYFYFPDHGLKGGNPIPSAYFATEEYREQRSRPETFDDMRQPLMAGEEEKIAEYYESVLHLSA